MKTSTESQPALTSTDGPQQPTAAAKLVESFLMNITGARRLYLYPERADKFFKSECRTDSDGASEIEYAANVEAARDMLAYAEKALAELQGHGLPAILYQRCCRALAVWELTDADWAETAKQFESWADAATKPPAAGVAAANQTADTAEYVFRRDNAGLWDIRFENESTRLANSAGLERICRLLQSDRERGISAAELMGNGTAGNVANLPCDTGGNVADGQAIAAAEKKIGAIELEIDDTVNPERIAELKDQKKQLTGELVKMMGRGRRVRAMQPTPAAKAASAARNSITAAINSLQKPMPRFYAYLLGRIQTGQTCYFINSGDNWQTDTMPT